jgi:hypothetical protein
MSYSKFFLLSSNFHRSSVIVLIFHPKPTLNFANRLHTPVLLISLLTWYRNRPGLNFCHPVPAGPCRRCRCRHVGFCSTPLGHVTMPPLALAASAATSPCRHWHWRQVLQKYLFYSHALLSASLLGLCHVTLPATRMAAGPTRRTEPPAGNGNGGRGLPALAPRVAWPGVPPLIGGLF